jgi:hypothetical protein
MEYRGIRFEVVQAACQTCGKWSLLIGDPQMLRIGEAASEQEAMAQVKQVIDRVLAIEASRRRQNGRPE